MTNIKLTYTKKTLNKYVLTIKDGEKEISVRTYTGTPEDHELYSGFVDFMNDKLITEQQNKDFSIKNVDDFRAWANSSLQRSYLEYIDSKDTLD